MHSSVKVLALAAGLALLSHAATAEEVAAAGAPWQGAYAGLHVGYGWTAAGYDEAIQPAPFDGDFSGAVGGAYAGYGLAFGSFVLGAEADAGVSGAGFPADDSSGNGYTALEQNWTAHLRLRAGFACADTLFYAAGGLAMTGLDVDDSDTGFGNDHLTFVGWTVGGGLEHAITQQLRLRVEYLYDDYGSQDGFVSAPEGSGFEPGYPVTVDLHSHIARIGLAWQF